MRRLLKNENGESKKNEADELKKEIAKEEKIRHDDVVYLENRIASEENGRMESHSILVKLMQCKANIERIEELEKKVAAMEKRIDKLSKKQNSPFTGATRF